MAKKQNKTKNKGASVFSNLALKQKMFWAFFLVTALIVLPSTLLLAIGMAPTFVAFFIVQRNKRSKAVTIGAMNIAGCMPFLLDLWSKGHTLERSTTLITDPFVVVVIYAGAAFGYALYWFVVSTLSSLTYTKTIKDTETLKKRQEDLIERWGEEVSGELQLNEFGFPSEEELEMYKKKKALQKKEEKRHNEENNENVVQPT